MGQAALLAEVAHFLSYPGAVLVFRGHEILLRDFAEQDRGPFLALASDEAMFTHMKFRYDRATAESRFPSLLSQPTPNPSTHYNFVIEDRDGFAGWAIIGPVQGNQETEFGWYLPSSRWGRGYATEATNLMVDFGFSLLGLSLMWATADPENSGAVRVLEKSGLRNEGLTDPVHTWRGMRPRLLFTISAEEWAGGTPP